MIIFHSKGKTRTRVYCAMKKGILLVNLGTPDSPSPRDVYRYLIEFLTDKRVIDSPWLWRQILVRGMIVPRRYKQSAHSYQQIWTEKGSPLMVYGKKVQHLLQESLGGGFLVELAMRYQNPSIETAIHSLIKKGVEEILVLPMFPQYASATTGSVHEKVMDIVKNFQVIPKIKFINHYATHPDLIQAFSERAQEYALDQYDHFIFSFHGLPKKQVLKADRQGTCFQCQHCCLTNKECYVSQCLSTGEAIRNQLQIPKERCSLTFQSRLGRDPWLEPFTSDRIKQLAKEGKKRVLVFCPSFVCDCLETIFEIGEECSLEFKHAGGELLDYVKGLNDHPAWIKTLHNLCIGF